MGTNANSGLQLDAQAVRKQVARILENSRFSSSGRLQALLRYTVEEALQGRSSQLKETVIGMDVFERDSSYDPRIDPVVRVMAGRMRNRLAEYYAAEGEADPLRIEYPKGTYAPRFELPPSRDTDAPVAPSVQSQTPSIAVLPLATLSPDPEQEFFSDGMAEAIITDLSRIAGLRVISRTSVLQFKKTSLPIPEIARKLDVGYLVEGSVMHGSGRVRITLQLIAYPPERHLWAESYESDLSDVLRLQADLARKVAAEIHVRLPPLEPARPTSPPPVNPDAYLKYLQGNYSWRARPNADAVTVSIGILEEAVRLDPSLALAYAALSEAAGTLARYYYRPGAAAQARKAANTAVMLDAALPEGRVALASVLLDDYEWIKAQSELEQVLTTNPNYAPARIMYGELLVRQGDLERGVVELQRARVLDPLSLLTNESLGVVLMRAHRYEEAMECFQRSVEMEPRSALPWLHMAICSISAGRFSDAIICAKKPIEANHARTDMLALTAAAHARLGRREQAHEILEELTQSAAAGATVGPHSFAAIHTALGEHGRAIDWLEKTVEQRTFLGGYLAVDVFWDDLRHEPRFQAIISRLRLHG